MELGTVDLCLFCIKMKNLAMARKVRKGEAIDLRGAKRTEEGEYILEEFVDGVDYCDTEREVWIWSIGVNGYGEIRAATDGRFYQSERNGWKCLFLR